MRDYDGLHFGSLIFLIAFFKLLCFSYISDSCVYFIILFANGNSVDRPQPPS